MRLLIFSVVALCLAVIAYTFSVGGTVAGLIFFFVLFNGILDRWAQPMLQRLRA